MTRTFFPDGSFDLEWVDTSLRIVDLHTEHPRYNTPKHACSFIHKQTTDSEKLKQASSNAAAAAVSPVPSLVLMLASLVSRLAVKPSLF